MTATETAMQLFGFGLDGRAARLSGAAAALRRLRLDHDPAASAFAAPGFHCASAPNTLTVHSASLGEQR